jgi:hypothetical protein
VRSGDVLWMDMKARKSGCHFIWIAESSPRGGVGVGQTAQAAIAGALKLALRRVNPDFNAANIDRINLKQYPWFFTAKVRVSPIKFSRTQFCRYPAKPCLSVKMVSSNRTPSRELWPRPLSDRLIPFSLELSYSAQLLVSNPETMTLEKNSVIGSLMVLS